MMVTFGKEVQVTVYKPRWWRRSWLATVTPYFNGKRLTDDVTGRKVRSESVTAHHRSALRKEVFEVVSEKKWADSWLQVYFKGDI